ncbi:MAG: bifunctional UDP-N-acetylmuramoyl-tripeptide:D-alanyl-D-alanine ligase/alanine racemase [Prevotella sp.]|nr:bifunctional UDP-N-acetylmuramoyl-tripeptide:D-alanyl-D-alanine ligase/alanine racemase [Prevotellaceae bacterium]MDY5249407.1 bifunctional UDP-N-acetylmuramoyl-tripeptide:D-alanyl-D-alanine ligase/alanine racemase [Prevotella sp.]
MRYSIEKIATLIGARRVGTRDANVGWLLTDSRSLCFPEETLFFALRSERNDGHRYIPELYRRGVRNFVVDTLPASIGDYGDANFLKVAGTLEALQRLAERHREEFDIPVVGITGSNGKTMVKEWLYQLLSPQMVVTRSPRSYNSQIGVPLSVWLLNEHSQVGVFEAGISEPGEMAALRDIIQPTIGVITSLGDAHQEHFRSMEEKCREKMGLFHDTQVIVYDADDDVMSRCVRQLNYHGQKVAWSKDNPRAAMLITSTEITTDAHGSAMTVVTYSFHGNQGVYHLPFIDEASLACSYACACVALHLGITPEALNERMSTLDPVAMRLEVKEGQRGCTIINDTYNSDVNSIDIALDFMNRRPDSMQGRRTVILSDIFQSGITPQQLYSEVSALMVKRGITKFIGIGAAISEQRDTIDVDEKYFFDTVEQFVQSQSFATLHDEVILVKGSRVFGFDRLTEQLEKKVHETILEVDLNAVVDNLNHYRSFLHADTKIVCMVKADAYGAGAVEVAKTLQDHCVDYLAVAVADEGVILRKAGITSNIIVMNPEMTSFKTLFDYDLEPEVYCFRLMDALIKAAEKEGITGFPVHVKLDTGMHRLGFNPVDDMDEVIARLKRQTAIIPRSVFSHFVGSDSDDFDAFSAHQYELFMAASERLQSAYDHKILRHICNSAGIEHFPERQLDMCRLGLGLYGIDSRDNHILNTVSTLKTTILQLRHVPANETVGYSRKGVLHRDSIIAAIPIGYADGLNRHLGRGAAYCLVNGQKAPYVGNICMDVAMIDVTDIPCHEGDQVEIFGKNLPVTVLSDILDTIPYEVLTGISGRVKRVYFQ